MTTTLPKPRSAKATILLGLITRLEISEQDYDFNSFRTRLSDLRLKHKLPIRHKEIKGTNQFGHAMVYRVHYLWRISIPKAKKLYLLINSPLHHNE